MDLGKEYGYNKELANGKWFNVNGIRVKLAYMNAPKVEAEVKIARDDARLAIGRPLTEAEHEKIGSDIFKKHVILDWDEDLTLNGEKFPFTPDNVDIVVSEYPRFIFDCIQTANNNKEFQTASMNEAVGK